MGVPARFIGMTEILPPLEKDGRDSPYEFRFLFNGHVWAIHTAPLPNDAEACERARRYLAAVEACDCVVVRNGVRFMQRITDRSDGACFPPVLLM